MPLVPGAPGAPFLPFLPFLPCRCARAPVLILDSVTAPALMLWVWTALSAIWLEWIRPPAVAPPTPPTATSATAPAAIAVVLANFIWYLSTCRCMCLPAWATPGRKELPTRCREWTLMDIADRFGLPRRRRSSDLSDWALPALGWTAVQGLAGIKVLRTSFRGRSMKEEFFCDERLRAVQGREPGHR